MYAGKNGVGIRLHLNSHFSSPHQHNYHNNNYEVTGFKWHSNTGAVFCWLSRIKDAALHAGGKILSINYSLPPGLPLPCGEKKIHEFIWTEKAWE
jgi:hypothetical protein